MRRSTAHPRPPQWHVAGAAAQVFFELGVKFMVAQTWEGGRTDERKLKNRKHARVLCPIYRIRKLTIRASQQRTRRSQLSPHSHGSHATFALQLQYCPCL